MLGEHQTITTFSFARAFNKRSERDQFCDLGYGCATRLFGSFHRDALPARDALCCVGFVAQTNVRMPCNYRHNACDSQLSCFLYDQIKFLTFKQRERKRQLQRRFGTSRFNFADYLEVSSIAAAFIDAAQEFLSFTI